MPLNVDKEQEYKDDHQEQQEKPKIYYKYEQIRGLK